jgi:hypothetical protein
VLGRRGAPRFDRPILLARDQIGERALHLVEDALRHGPVAGRLLRADAAQRPLDEQRRRQQQRRREQSERDAEPPRAHGSR